MSETTFAILFGLALIGLALYLAYKALKPRFREANAPETSGLAPSSSEASATPPQNSSSSEVQFESFTLPSENTGSESLATNQTEKEHLPEDIPFRGWIQKNEVLHLEPILEKYRNEALQELKHIGPTRSSLIRQYLEDENYVDPQPDSPQPENAQPDDQSEPVTT